MKQQQNLSMSYRRKSILSLSSILIILLFCFHSSAFSQASAPQGGSNPDYVISHVRALDRLNKEKQVVNRTQTSRTTLSATTKAASATELLDDLVKQYVDEEGFTLMHSGKTIAPAEISVANVRYYVKEGNGGYTETDNYNFFTGKMFHKGVSAEEIGNKPEYFAHLGNVSKYIRDAKTGDFAYQMTIFNHGATVTSAAFSMITEASAKDIEKERKRLTAASINEVRYLVRKLEATGNRSESSEIVLLSPSNSTTSATGIYETRMYPDDYTPTIITEYRFHFTENTSGPVFFAYQIDSKLGENDVVPVYRKPNKRGMYMCAKIPDNIGPEYRFTYSIPTISGSQPIQYSANYYQKPFYSVFDRSRRGDGAEVAIETPPGSIYTILQQKANSKVDAGMFFKDKGKEYNAGDVASFTLVQGVSASVLPELDFTDGYFDYELELGKDFNFEVNGLKWIDENKGSGLAEDPKSLGGKVHYVQLQGGTEIGSNEFVGSYDTNNGTVIAGELDYTGGTVIIPKEKLKKGLNVFKLTIENQLQMGTLVNTKNFFILTINVYETVTTNINVQDVFGNTINLPSKYKSSYSGRENTEFDLIIPEKFDYYEFESISPVASGAKNADGDFVYPMIHKSRNITIVYRATKVPLTIQFRHKGNLLAKIYSDPGNKTNPYVEDYKADVIVGTNIATQVQQWIDSNKIKLTHVGYNAVEVNDYIVPILGENRPTIVQTPTTIVYEFTGVLTNFK